MITFIQRMNDEIFSKKALEISLKGYPDAFPNPLVGCVIINHGEIVASGYHQKYGGHHAEVNAIKSLPERYNPAECVLYVTLEPCSHHGKTAPCADLIISKGFKKVVIASQDPNPLVAGKGIEKLKNAGIEVTSGVLEKEARELNKRFFTYHEKKRPYFILKWAQTADGFISRWPVPQNREDNWISSSESNQMVHELRAETMAIMVGKNTVLSDNPSLTVRHVKGKNPIRIILDKNLETPSNLNIYNQDAQTIILNSLREEEESEFLRYIKLDFSEGVLEEVSEKLYELGIQSVLVEGGAILLESLLKKDLWDEAIIIENPALFFKNGIKAPEMELKTLEKMLGGDKLFRCVREKS